MDKLRLVQPESAPSNPDNSNFEHKVIDDIDSVTTVSSRQADIVTAHALKVFFDKYIES